MEGISLRTTPRRASEPLADAWLSGPRRKNEVPGLPRLKICDADDSLEVQWPVQMWEGDRRAVGSLPSERVIQLANVDPQQDEFGLLAEDRIRREVRLVGTTHVDEAVLPEVGRDVGAFNLSALPISAIGDVDDHVAHVQSVETSG